MKRLVFIAITVLLLFAYSITAAANDRKDYDRNDPGNGIDCILDHDM